MTTHSAERSIILDVRCLQDPNYAVRGVGRHALGMLRHAPLGLHLVGLTDPGLPELSSEARSFLHAVHINVQAAEAATRHRRPACFVMMSPITHDPLFAARLLSNARLLRTAIVYDFIPYHHPDRYLPSPADRMNYAVALRWMARCDLFAPISQSTADDLVQMLGVPETSNVVTGCALHPSFELIAAAARGFSPRHLLVVGGGDWRKNPEVVIRAHARSSVMQHGAGIPLVVAGGYSPEDARRFRAVASAAGGRGDLIEVPGHVSEVDLAGLYGRALAIVCPSHDEGFSLPVIEGMVAGLPCLASDIPAHAELVEDADCRFPPDDDAALRPKLERVVVDTPWRAAVLARQAEVWRRFRASAVAERFWGAILQRLEPASPAVLRGRRPRVAMLSPVPPDRSGVADYTAATCAELGRLVDLHIFTEAARPVPIPNVTAIRPLTEMPHLNAGFDRVISVVGNSAFHLRIFETLRRYGGACIAHDSRMLGFYRSLLGVERALAVAGKELGRVVTEAELKVWHDDEGKLEALFLGEIAESASPTVVHSAITARIIQQRYGIAASCLPFSIYHPWTAQELTQECRAAARARLGLSPTEIVIATFGFVDASKAPDDCVWALEVLRSWGIQASLHFVGVSTTYPGAVELRNFIGKLGLEQHVRFAEGYVSERTYRDYLVGADLAAQLRTYGLGSLSGALLDCAAAGLPAVTNVSLAEAVGVPDYIRSIPDAISPLLLAEAFADLLAAGFAGKRPEAARLAFSEERSCAAYARGLGKTLELDLPLSIPTTRVRVTA